MKRSRKRRTSKTDGAPSDQDEAQRSATVAAQRARLAMLGVGLACACRAALILGRELQISAVDDYRAKIGTAPLGDALEWVGAVGARSWRSATRPGWSPGSWPVSFS